MFGIGIEELLLIIFVIFLISPKELPKILKKIAEFFSSLNSIKDEITELNEDVKEIINDTDIKEDIEEITKEDKNEITDER
jgi:Sec-independent protein translocase protein TatA